ncbi:hypothetical protein HanXRQr2_Chr04g0181341 [Helianthus annuus]|uniref:Uncharacterized protein n=1 Tax=Helianthus annuus TaxID=4232 RepID=A0A9K3J9R9_HELAN|nr:hypothetical protein HanXRQr2_Chr04g0181341 [Helianthus annuus]KAJ0758693.1 hypothetical protein HanLR1_Chr04g0153221 [Helianthus annuus]
MSQRSIAQRSISHNSYSDANSSKIPNCRTEPSGIICSCGAATCYKYSGSKANLDRRYLCCLGGCGFKRWDDKESCPCCDNVIPTLLRLIENKDEIAIKKAKEQAEKQSEDVDIEEAEDDNFTEVPTTYNESFDDYDSVIEVLKAEDEKAAKETGVLTTENYKMKPKDYDPEVLEMAWDYTIELEDDWYHDPYPGEHSSDSEWPNDDAHGK